METRYLFRCKWSVEHYTDNNPKLFYHNRVRLTCIESDNPIYPVGYVFTAAEGQLFKAKEGST